MTSDAVMRAAVAALVGAGIGWGANALTLAGRVEAIEKGQARIEAQIERLVQLRKGGDDAQP